MLAKTVYCIDSLWCLLRDVNCERNTDVVVAGYKVDKEKRTGLNKKCILQKRVQGLDTKGRKLKGAWAALLLRSL